MNGQESFIYPEYYIRIGPWVTIHEGDVRGEKMGELKLYYESPASRWEETLPVGNGSLGGMVFGGVGEEIIGLNEESLWSGYERKKDNPGAIQHLEEVRRLIFEDKCKEAEKLIQKNMLGEYNESYLPLGNLHISYGNLKDSQKVTQYSRMLNLEDAVANVTFVDEQGVKYTREVFCSYPLSAMIIRLSASCPVMDLNIYLESELRLKEVAEKDHLIFFGQCPEHMDPSYIRKGAEAVVWGYRGIRFSGEIKILSCDENVRIENGQIHVEKGREIILLLAAVKPYKRNVSLSYEKLKEEHRRDYQALFQKVDLYLGEQTDIPTDKRLEALKKGYDDPALYALYFQYGRYLMIASSRKGSLPANLQGIWSWQMQAPWSSNWTTNINAEMNYWPALPCGLKECMEPYFSMVERLAEKGKDTARIHYGCRGFTHHHNADVWGCTNPVGIAYGEEEGRDGCVTWSMWPMGGAWLVQEFFRYYEFTKDETFLRERAYPVTREAALFLLDWFIMRDGYYVTCPSTSPENKYVTKEGETCSVTQASTMDLELIREVFGHLKEMCEILSINDPILSEIDEKLEKLLPFRTGSQGQLLEWYEEYKEAEPGHRHISHLYGLFPSELFEGDEKMREACRISLMRRLEHGGGYTGWSCAWIINMFAVLKDGEGAYQYLNTLLTRSTYPNLWDAHEPFQIDGNFGGTAGIANMLVQDRNHKVSILPALPRAWRRGYVKGLCIKDGKCIDIKWDETGEKHRIYPVSEL